MTWFTAAVLILSAAPETRRIEDPERGFSFELPGDANELEGFVRPGPQVRTGTLGNWGSKLDTEQFVIISIEGLGGPIAREPVELSALGKPGVTALKEKWKGFELDGFRLVEAHGGDRILILAVQVPLAPTGIQVMTSGLAENEPAVRNALLGVLGTLEGRSTWLTDEERLSAGMEGALRLTISFATAFALAFGAWRFVRRRRAG